MLKEFNKISDDTDTRIEVHLIMPDCNNFMLSNKFPFSVSFVVQTLVNAINNLKGSG